MLRDGWNFHNDVAMVIENKSRSCFGFTYGDYNMFSADEVECGTFAGCMMLMLRKKSKYCKSNDEIEAFIEKYKSYIGKSGHEIAAETAQLMIEEFVKIYNSIEE